MAQLDTGQPGIIGLEWQQDESAPTVAQLVDFLEEYATTKQQIRIYSKASTGERGIYVDQR